MKNFTDLVAAATDEYEFCHRIGESEFPILWERKYGCLVFFFSLHAVDLGHGCPFAFIWLFLSLSVSSFSLESLDWDV